jgi:RNA polymerase sigma factor (sigma-70 family)
MTTMAPELTEPVTDAALISGSRTAPDLFGELYDRHAREVHRYLARRVGSPQADDLVSEVFLAAFRLRARYDLTRTDARPWLYGIATNLLRRHHRGERAQYRVMARTGVDPLGGLDHAEDVVARICAESDARAVAAGMAGLTAKERDVLLLFAWAGLGYEEISDALDIPVGTVRSRLNRARTRLREAIENPRIMKNSPNGRRDVP